jgi:Protein of unknown function (DUF1638)
MTTARQRVLVIACGALLREFRALIKQLERIEHGPLIELQLLPANLHNRPERIPGEVRELIEDCRDAYDVISIGYADCGTGGLLDAVCDEFGVNRLPGSHCYEFFAGGAIFAALHEEEPGTFYLTDYLARHFDALVIGALGLDRHPELLGTYFANYKRLCFLSQTDNDDLLLAAQAAADRLGLEFFHRPTGMTPFADIVQNALLDIDEAVPFTVLPALPV